MSDLVVTLPLAFGMEQWIDEGDPAGEPWSGTEWGFSVVGGRPGIQPGERVYVVFNRRLIGYAPLIRVERLRGYNVLVRGGGAVAVTIPQEIIGFRGWRYRWWEPSIEVPCFDWTKPFVPPPKISREKKLTRKHAEIELAKLRRWKEATS